VIDERDQYLTYKIRTAPGKKIVAAVGAGHVPGILRYWQEPIDIRPLEETPPKGPLSKVLKWVVPVSVIALMVLGFFVAGSAGGKDMIASWVIATGVLAGLGAGVALAHPLTILVAVAAAPFTTLHPMIAAGWAAGLSELFVRKPKVKDFERLSQDIGSVKGFWRNRISRILLVVVFTNIGASVGTFVAIPLMMRAFS
jgi:pheromone shutdown-related protein TraB